MRKSTKIILVAAAAVLLCAFLLLGALYLEDSGYWAADEEPEEDLREEQEDDESDEEDSEESDPEEEAPEEDEPEEDPDSGETPTEVPGQSAGAAEPEEPEAAALEIHILDVAASYPTLELYCEIYYEGTADFVSGLPLDIFRVVQTGADGGECELLAVSQLMAAASPVGKDCYELVCTAPEDVLEGNVKLEVMVDAERYAGRASTVVEQLALPEEPLKSDEHYVVIRADVSWEEAALMAEEMGGHLVDINSEAEYRQILPLVEEAGLKVFWAGARIARVEDDWEKAQWITGKPMDFVDWYPGEPNKEADDELYLMVFCVDGVWAYNDAPGDSHQYYTGKIGYICEFEAVE